MLQAAGGEDVLLNSLAESGLQCDPFTQLVVTCEVCRRPATKECWTCGMQICEFCTLKRHWKVRPDLQRPVLPTCLGLTACGLLMLDGRHSNCGPS